MPDRSTKVRWSQLKVGVVGLTAFLILSLLIFLLTSSKNPFQRTATLHVYLDDASGITDSTPVRLNGITIGSVDKVSLSNSGDPKRTVEFDLQVQESYLPEIPVDSVAGITASNLLGDKFINITKGRAPRHVQDGGEIKSLQAQDIPELMAQSASLLATFQTIVNRRGCAARRRRTGQGQHRKAAQGRRVVRPAERHRLGDATTAGRRAQRPRHHQQADLRRYALPGAALAPQTRGCDSGRFAGRPGKRRQAPQGPRAVRRGEAIAGRRSGSCWRTSTPARAPRASS